MVCRKVKFDEHTADLALWKAAYAGNTNRMESGKYYCNECSAYHLTSKTRRTGPKKKENDKNMTPSDRIRAMTASMVRIINTKTAIDDNGIDAKSLLVINALCGHIKHQLDKMADHYKAQMRDLQYAATRKARQEA